MNVSINGTRHGVVDSPRPAASGDVPRAVDGDGARPGRDIGELHRRAWFDFNGDGKIDDRNPLYGGDGTLVGVKAPPGPTVREAADVRPPTAVVVEHARDAYARYAHRPPRNGAERTTGDQPPPPPTPAAA